MMFLVDNIHQIPKGLQDFVVLKVTERRFRHPFQNLNTLPNQRFNSIIVSIEEGGNID